jgi:hypothetical protein
MGLNSGPVRLMALCAIAFGLAAGGMATNVVAQAASEKTAVQRAYQGGVKAFQAAKYQSAVDQLSSALRIGGLGNSDLARAMYLRGVSYKRLNKPGLAVSDLTSAIWINNGLSDADKQAAIAERADAYNAAGISGGATVAAAASSAAPVAAASAPPAQAAQAAGSAPPVAIDSPFVSTVTRQPATSSAAQEAANARRLAATPVDAGGLTRAATAHLTGNTQPSDATVPLPVSPAPSPLAAAAEGPANTASPVFGVPSGLPSDATPSLSVLPADDAPAAGGTADLSAIPQAIGGFFSNIFGGGAGSPSAPVAQASEPVATLAAGPPADAAPAPPPMTTAALPSATVAAPLPSASVKPSAAPPVAKPAQPAQPQVKSGKYKLHIAAMRSRDEAEAVAQKLAAAHAGDLASRVPAVDEAVIGSMGTFYRVRVGSFANAAEPKAICDKLRSGGFDCLVVTN